MAKKEKEEKKGHACNYENDEVDILRNITDNGEPQKSMFNPFE